MNAPTNTPTVASIAAIPDDPATAQMRAQLNAMQPGLGDLIRSPEQMAAETDAMIAQLTQATEQARAAQLQASETMRQAATQVATEAIAARLITEMEASGMVWDEERKVGCYIKTSRNTLAGIQVGLWIGAATVVAFSLAARRFTRAKR